MLKIVWDDKLPPTPAPPTEIERWDQWFGLVGLSKEWAVVKEQFPNDNRKLITWAKVMELNRISALSETSALIAEQAGSAEVRAHQAGGS